MELNKLKILENIGKVYEDSKNCKLDKEFFTKINIKLSEAILDNRPMPKMDDTTVGDVYDLLEKLDDLVEQRYDEELSSPQAIYQI